MKPTFRRRLLLTALLFILSIGLSTQPTRAATSSIFDVDSFDDLTDDIVNSVCSVGAVSGGPCTLRAAIKEANYISHSNNVVINLPAGTYHLTIPPTGSNDIDSGDLNFWNPNAPYNITLHGTDEQPAIIDANLLDRIIRVDANVTVYLENIVIRGGLLLKTDSNKVDIGAGILNRGTMALTHVVVEDNEARCGQATCSFHISGGGIMNDGKMNIKDTIIRNNTSVAASAIRNTGNSSGIIIQNSSIYNNQATQAFTIESYGDLHIRNSTISGNAAGPDYIAGIANYAYLVIESSTLANLGKITGVYNAASGSVKIKDSIMNDTDPSDFGNCYNDGAWDSSGYNIYSDNTCPITGTGDLANTNPLLGWMAFWGGKTPSMPLLAGSPAKDHRPENCVTIPFNPVLPPELLTIDQRYYPRNDGMCDTGAFEGIGVTLPSFFPLIYK